MSSNIYGIDFGTCNFKVFSKAGQKIYTEKNTIAIINKNQIYAYAKLLNEIVLPLIVQRLQIRCICGTLLI